MVQCTFPNPMATWKPEHYANKSIKIQRLKLKSLYIKPLDGKCWIHKSTKPQSNFPTFKFNFGAIKEKCTNSINGTNSIAKVWHSLDFMRMHFQHWMQINIENAICNCSQSGYMCMIFYRRDTHVAEIQMGLPAVRLEDACTVDNFDVMKLPYVTLVGM